MSKTILVVEDNPEERRIYSEYLRFVGGNLLEASNGEEGLRQAREHRPDLILMDLSMPVMDGWEAIRGLKADPDTRGIPVIAVTAHRRAPEELTEAGFCGYLEKPLAPYHVLVEVERCLGRMHSDQELGSAAESSIPPQASSTATPRPEGSEPAAGEGVRPPRPAQPWRFSAGRSPVSAR